MVGLWYLLYCFFNFSQCLKLEGENIYIFAGMNMKFIKELETLVASGRNLERGGRETPSPPPPPAPASHIEASALPLSCPSSLETCLHKHFGAFYFCAIRTFTHWNKSKREAAVRCPPGALHTPSVLSTMPSYGTTARRGRHPPLLHGATVPFSFIRTLRSSSIPSPVQPRLRSSRAGLGRVLPLSH